MESPAAGGRSGAPQKKPGDRDCPTRHCTLRATLKRASLAQGTPVRAQTGLTGAPPHWAPRSTTMRAPITSVRVAPQQAPGPSDRRSRKKALLN